MTSTISDNDDNAGDDTAGLRVALNIAIGSFSTHEDDRGDENMVLIDLLATMQDLTGEATLDRLVNTLIEGPLAEVSQRIAEKDLDITRLKARVTDLETLLGAAEARAQAAEAALEAEGNALDDEIDLHNETAALLPERVLRQRNANA